MIVFSIIIPNWNGKKLLEKNLPKVLAAASRETEVIVVENGSIDGSLEYLKKILFNSSTNGSMNRFIELSKNYGFSYAVNLGVKEARGKIIVLLNNDVVPEKGFLKPLKKNFADKSVFAVSLNEINNSKFSWSKGKFEKGFVIHESQKKDNRLHATFWASGGSGAFRKRMWQKLDGFDSIYHPFYWEDIDLCYRAQKRGWKILWEPKAKVAHEHEWTIKGNFSQNYIDLIRERNQLLFIWKNITDKNLISEHKRFLIKRAMKNPGYFKVILAALVKLIKVSSGRSREKEEANLTDKQIFNQGKKMLDFTLSIIIVSFNTKDILEKCLASLKTGCWGLKSSWEVIVVDNASTDGSVEFLKKWSARSAMNRFIVLNNRNLGFSKAVNQGIKKAGGKYILLLNSDIVCQKASITKLLEFAENKKDLGLAGGRLLNPDKTPQASVFRLPTVFRAIREFWFGQGNGFQKYLPDKQEPVEIEAVVGAVMLIPKKTIEKIGLLDGRLFMYFEDLDYCRRIGKMGLKVYYLPEAKFIHYHGQSGKKIPGKVSRYLVESSKIYYGTLRHYLISSIIWSGQKWQKLIGKK